MVQKNNETIPPTLRKTDVICCGVLERMRIGWADLKARPEYFEKFNNPNGCGTYEHFVPFVAEYLDALKEHPDAEIRVSR